MTAASVLSFLLCGTAASASTETANSWMPANSFLVEYTLSGLTVGNSYPLIMMEAPYTDATLDYCGYFGSFVSDTQKYSGYLTVVGNIPSATSSTMTIATLKFFWSDLNYAYSIQDPKLNYIMPSDSNSNYQINKKVLALGDLNYDGYVNLTDVGILLEALGGDVWLTNDERKIADVDMDGEITMYDALKLRKWVESEENTPIWD